MNTHTHKHFYLFSSPFKIQSLNSVVVCIQVAQQNWTDGDQIMQTQKRLEIDIIYNYRNTNTNNDDILLTVGIYTCADV